MDALINTITNRVEDSFWGIEVTPKETQTLIKNVSNDVAIGWTYNPSDKTFSKSDEVKLKEIRRKRSILLTDSDYTQFADSTHRGTKEEWKTYRQELRDITKGVTDPDKIVFPEEPK